MGRQVVVESRWPRVQALAQDADVEILPTGDATAVEGLADLTLADVVIHSGGILIDGGWLRVLGAGNADRGLLDFATANAGGLGVEPHGAIVGYDVMGGQFSLVAESVRMKPTIHYYQPDEARWLDLMVEYGEWLMLMISGSTTEFYADLRWTGWREDVATCPLDSGYLLDPPPWSSRGRDVAAATRRLEPADALLARVSAAHI